MTTTKPARTQNVRLRGLDVQVDLHGEGGTPVVLLSGGAAGCTSYFPYVVAGLPDATVVVHDRLGTGRSPQPPVAPNLRSWSDDVVGLLDQLGIDKAVLVGHSLGGALAAQLVLDAPQRVAGALLLDPTPVNDVAAVTKVVRAFGPISALARLPLVGGALLKGLLSLTAPKGLSPEAQQAFESTLVGDWIGDTGRAISGLVEDARAFSVRERTADVPVVVVIADRKATSPARLAQERLAAQLGGTVELWPGTRHELHLQQPQKVVERIKALL